jgi:transcriptional regulator with XRE-family HTH domain
MNAVTLSANLLRLMAQKKKDELPNFGERLAALRKRAGLTQTELAERLDVTQRVITYYENESDWPPVHLLPKIAKVFDITVDELMSAGAVEVSEPKPLNKRLLKRLEVVEQLPTQDQKMVLRLINTLAAKAS